VEDEDGRCYWRKNRGRTPLILNSSTWWREVINSMLCLLYSYGKQFVLEEE
jgi:hypothetical protein